MNQAAVVTGASRGVGKGIAEGLGEAGMTVYVTGRTLDPAQAAVPLAGSIGATAADVTARGGTGIAVRCDHRDDAQVEAVFQQVQRDHGRLDLLVNNAWAGYEGYSTGAHFLPLHPFWQKPIRYWDENLDGVRWAYVASVHAARQMTAAPSAGQPRLIVNISFGTLDPGNVAYNIAKTATDRLTLEMAHQLRDYNIAVVSLYPGLVRTEGVLLNAQYFDLSQSESPLFTGRAVAALAADPQVMAKSGAALVVADLAREYGFADEPMS